MKRMLATAALFAAVTFSLTGPSPAEDFPAAPLNHGAPTNLPGDTLVPGLHEALVGLNTVTQPLIQPILAPDGGAAPVEPVHHHRQHHGGEAYHHHGHFAAHRGRHARFATRHRNHGPVAAHHGRHNRDVARRKGDTV